MNSRNTGSKSNTRVTLHPIYGTLNPDDYPAYNGVLLPPEPQPKVQQKTSVRFRYRDVYDGQFTGAPDAEALKEGTVIERKLYWSTIHVFAHTHQLVNIPRNQVIYAPGKQVLTREAFHEKLNSKEIIAVKYSELITHDGEKFSGEKADIKSLKALQLLKLGALLLKVEKTDITKITVLVWKEKLPYIKFTDEMDSALKRMVPNLDKVTITQAAYDLHEPVHIDTGLPFNSTAELYVAVKEDYCISKFNFGLSAHLSPEARRYMFQSREKNTEYDIGLVMPKKILSEESKKTQPEEYKVKACRVLPHKAPPITELTGSISPTPQHLSPPTPQYLPPTTPQHLSPPMPPYLSSTTPIKFIPTSPVVPRSAPTSTKPTSAPSPHVSNSLFNINEKLLNAIQTTPGMLEALRWNPILLEKIMQNPALIDYLKNNLDQINSNTANFGKK